MSKLLKKRVLRKTKTILKRKAKSLLKAKSYQWHMATLAMILFSTLFATGCATNESQHSDSGNGSGDKSHPAADLGGRFNVGAPRTVREKGEPAGNFFFRECEDSGNSTYYSKTSYNCN